VFASRIFHIKSSIAPAVIARHVILMVMRLRALLGWGITIYALSYLTWSIFIAYGLSVGVVSKLISLAALFIVAAIAGRSLHFSSWRDILPYSIGWAVIIAIIDGILAFPFAGWSIYTEVGVWIGYLVVIITPLFFNDEIWTGGDELRKRLT